MAIAGLGGEHSYRGYYSDLSFSPTHEVSTVGKLLEQCKSAMGQVYEGYKGGDFVMGALTPLFVADYGCTGPRLMGLDTSDLVIKPITEMEE